MAVLPKPNPNSIMSRKKAIPNRPSIQAVPVVEPPIKIQEEKLVPKAPEVKAPVPRPAPRRVPPKVAPVPVASVAPVENTEVLELINRRQRQVILHSVLYYRMNTNLVTDKTWDTWARELVKLQADYPKIAEKSDFWEDMKDFDATTGFHLADHLWGVSKAEWILLVLKNSKKGVTKQ